MSTPAPTGIFAKAAKQAARRQAQAQAPVVRPVPTVAAELANIARRRQNAHRPAMPETGNECRAADEFRAEVRRLGQEAARILADAGIPARRHRCWGGATGWQAALLTGDVFLCTNGTLLVRGSPRRAHALEDAYGTSMFTHCDGGSCSHLDLVPDVARAVARVVDSITTGARHAR